jgi:hypothetical protein
MLAEAGKAQRRVAWPGRIHLLGHVQEAISLSRAHLAKGHVARDFSRARSTA